MTYARLIELKTACNAAGQHFHNLGMQNTINLTAEQQVELDVSYAIARRKMGDAEKAYTAALDEFMATRESN